MFLTFTHPASTYKFLVVVYIMSVIHVMGNFTRNGVDILSVGFGGWSMWHRNLSSIIIFTTFSKIITRMLIRWCGGRRGRFTEVSGHSSAIDVSRVVGVVQLTTTQYPFMEGFTNVPLLLLGSIS